MNPNTDDLLQKAIAEDPSVILPRLRKVLEVSQETVARKTGLAHCTVSAHENGHNQPFRITIKSYVEYFSRKIKEKGVDISEVLR